MYAGVAGHLRNLILSDPASALYKYLAWVFAWLGQWVMPVGFRHARIDLAVQLAVIAGMAMSVFMGLYAAVNYRFLWHSGCRNRLYLLLFLLASIAVGALARPQIFDIRYAVNERYSFYSLFAVVTLYSLVSSVERMKRHEGLQPLSVARARGWSAWFGLAAMAYAAAIYANALPALQSHKMRQQACVTLWEAHREAMPCLWHGENGSAMRDAEERGILRINRGIFSAVEAP